MDIEGEDNESYQAIADNVQQAYLCKLKDAAKRLRSMEREYIRKTSQLYGVGGEVKLPEQSDLDRGEQ